MRNLRVALTLILGFAALGAAQAITFRYDETYTTQEAVQAQMEKHGGQLHQFRPFMGESISFGLAVTYGSELRTGAIGVYGVKGQKTDFGLWINEKGSYEVCLHGASDGSDFTRDTGISAKPNGTDVLSLALFHKDGDADGTGVYDLCLAINGKTVMELTDVRTTTARTPPAATCMAPTARTSRLPTPSWVMSRRTARPTWIPGSSTLPPATVLVSNPSPSPPRWRSSPLAPSAWPSAAASPDPARQQKAPDLFRDRGLFLFPSAPPSFRISG